MLPDISYTRLVALAFNLEIGFISVVVAVFFGRSPIFCVMEWRKTSFGEFRPYRNCCPVVLLQTATLLYQRIELLMYDDECQWV